ncbi:MAG TPA: GMC family oxidoreductase N-terminal domain-containing protein [Pseudonocardiaceae bacterium]|nr:GMC family oxidoreductase N-terminal domain-containing protein [Pseudonocardiaceae bacterium]
MSELSLAGADYVVVGGGSAGCVVASRLADGGASVVLLEAGGSDRTRLVRVPGMITLAQTVPRLKKRLDWCDFSVPQRHARDRRIPMLRGRVLGGSGAVNGMLFVRGHREDYDSWAAQGCTGWAYRDVLPAFRRMENWEGGASELRGAGGPIEVTRQRNLSAAGRLFISALSDTLDVPELEDYNATSSDGVGPFQQNVRDGLRYTSSVGYLRAVPPNLRVQTGVTVRRVLISDGRATGVEVTDQSGTRTIRAAQEVVLCAGAIGSPQLLMLSGVGPAGHLRDLGLTVAADLPVGANLHDHVFLPMTFSMPGAGHPGTARHFLSGLARQVLFGGDTWFSRTVLEVVGFVRSSLAEGVPDLQIYTLPWSFPVPNRDTAMRTEDARPAMTVMAALLHPRSRGSLRLVSADPAVAPLIDPAYLAEPVDAEVLLEGAAMVRAVMASRGIAGEVTGSPDMNPDSIRDALPTRVEPMYHYACTCRMGIDERAVVDPQLRVRGVVGLRVADTSVMPAITGGNTNAPAMMIGERCAELMT